MDRSIFSHQTVLFPRPLKVKQSRKSNILGSTKLFHNGGPVSKPPSGLVKQVAGFNKPARSKMNQSVVISGVRVIIYLLNVIELSEGRSGPSVGLLLILKRRDLMTLRKKKTMTRIIIDNNKFRQGHLICDLPHCRE